MSMDTTSGLTAAATIAPLTPAVAAAEPVPNDEKKSFQISGIIGPIAVFALFIGFWYFMHAWGMRHILDKPPFLLPSPTEVIKDSFINKLGRENMITGLGWTSLVAFGGLAMTIVVGMTFAVLMAQARWLERSIYPYLVALQAMPVLALVPVIVSVFGGGLPPRFFVCYIISFFPIVTNTLFGVTSADAGQHDLFTLRRASRWTRLFKLQLPSAMPAIFTGFRISAGLSVIGAVVGEQFFRKGSRPGIGIIIEQYRQRNRFPQVYGGLLVAALLGIVTFIVFGLLGRLVVGHWHDSGQRRN